MAGEKSIQTSSVVKLSIGVLAILEVLTLVFCVHLYIQQGVLQDRLGQVEASKVVDSDIETQQNSFPNEDAQLTEHRQKRQASQCGRTYYISRTSTSIYSIQSPNYPLAYPPNSRCSWHFVLAFPEAYGYTGSSLVSRVALEIRFPYPIFVEGVGSSCSDAIEVRGGSDTGPLLATYCGTNRIVATVTFAGPIHVLFRSNGNAGNTGFRAQIQIAGNSGGSGSPGVTPSPNGNRSPGRDGPPNGGGQPGQGGPRGPPGAPGQRGSPGAPGAPGQRGSPDAEPGPPGPGLKGEGGRDGRPGERGTPTGHTTYIRWGKSRCTQGTPYYDGYAMGIASRAPQELICAPIPAQLRFTDTSITRTLPELTAARYSLGGVSGSLPASINDRPIRCALCHAERSASFVVIGWDSCNDSRWVTAYSGYAMTVSASAVQSSQMICVDKEADAVQGYGVGAIGPKLGFVKSGNGLWLENKLVPCAVCVKTPSN